MLIRNAEEKDLIFCESIFHIPELKLATGDYISHHELNEGVKTTEFLKLI